MTMGYSCLTPIYAHGRQLPCGKCGICVRKRTLYWQQRLTQESDNWRTTSFITLTYDDDHFPVKGVEVEDVQKFLKRLRKQGIKFKYYLVSEYGPQTLRPHYHAIFYHDLDPEFFYDRVYSAWRNGLISIGDVSEGRVNYCASYHITKSFVPPEMNKTFCTMSKGLGLNYLTPDRLEYFHRTGNMFVTSYDGYRLPLARYYKNKILFSPEQLQESKKLAESQSLIDDMSAYRLSKLNSKLDAYVKKKLKGRNL